MRQHLQLQNRGRILHRRMLSAAARAIVPVAAASIAYAASPESLAAQSGSPSTPAARGTGACSIHVAYASAGAFLATAAIRVHVTDASGAHGSGAEADVPSLGLRARADTTGDARLYIPEERIRDTDSVTVRIHGIGYKPASVRVHVASRSVATITAVLCGYEDDFGAIMTGEGKRVYAACPNWDRLLPFWKKNESSESMGFSSWRGGSEYDVTVDSTLAERGCFGDSLAIAVGAKLGVVYRTRPMFMLTHLSPQGAEQVRKTPHVIAISSVGPQHVSPAPVPHVDVRAIDSVRSSSTTIRISSRSTEPLTR